MNVLGYKAAKRAHLQAKKAGARAVKPMRPPTIHGDIEWIVLSLGEELA